MAEELNLSDKTLDRLSERLARAVGGKGGGGSSGGGSSGGGSSKSSGALDTATDKLAATFSGPLSTAAGVEPRIRGELLLGAAI